MNPVMGLQLSPRQKARFSPPKLPEGELERPRLLEALQSNIFRKLNLLCAAPGYGKTTLAAQFARAADFPAAWLQLEEGDRDASVFCEDLLTALQLALKDWLPPSSTILGLPATSDKPSALGSALANALDRTLTDFTALVIDDFHLVEDSRPVLEFMNALLRELPPSLHLVLISRHIPELHITPLVAGQQAAGFSEEHLRFTPAEVQELVEARNHISLPAMEAEELTATNEGWVTGILLSSHLLWKGIPLEGGKTGRDQVFHFLAGEVLEQQPEEIRRFMLEASILFEMEPAACDFILSRSDSRKLLAQLDARRLFIFSSGEEQPSYRFHNLFREFLRSSLRQRDPQRYEILLEKTGEWHLKAGLEEAAFSYFLEAGDFSRAASLAEKHVQKFYESGRFQTLQDWARRLYPVRQEVPRLFGCVAMTLGMSGDFPRAEEYLEIAREGLERSGDAARINSLQVSRAWLAYRKGEYEEGLSLAEAVLRKGEPGGVERADLRMAANHAGLCAGALGRTPEAVKYLRLSASLFPEQDKSYDRAHVLTYLANALHAAGDISEEYTLKRQALALWRELGFPGPIAIALNNMAYGQHMMGQLEEAEATYREAMEWSRKSGDRHSQLLIYAGLGDLKKDQARFAESAGYFSVANTLAEETDDVALTEYIYRSLADLNRRQGNYPAAMEWMRRAGGLAEKRTALDVAGDRLFQGILLEETGHREEGIGLLREALRMMEEGAAPKAKLAEADFLLARSIFRGGNAEEAGRLLRNAFDLALHSGSDQVLVREAVEASDMLDAFAADPAVGRLCFLLLERARRQAKGVMPAGAEAPSSGPLVLSVKALGSLEIAWAGREVTRSAWASQKTKEVFLFLVDRSPVKREDLLETFWPEMSSGRGYANLYQTLYRIRRAIGEDILVLKDQICRFTDDIAVEYDVSAFEKTARSALAKPLTDRGRVDELEAALRLFRGEYLHDLAVDWAGQRAEEINRLFLAVIREEADERIVLCRYEEARASVARGLEIDPYRDELHQRMLKILAAMGRKHEVVDHYQKYIFLLRKDLGLDPPSETRSLYASLIS
jgi:ATP/maltotriose-dependent transcriptional regulator MalT/two-component SAPR family response regulator